MDATRTTCDVLVVGAGISGLTLAHALGKHGIATVLVDAGDAPGGVIGTRERDGFLYETGANSALDTSPALNELFAELGILDERRDAGETGSKRFIVRDGKLVALPTSPGAFFTTPAFTLGAKVRLFREPFIPPSSPHAEETIAQFVRRRLGHEFLDYAIDPFVSGIYAGDPERISVPAAFPKLFALEQKYGSLIRGQIMGARERRKSAETSKNTAGSFSFARGMRTLPEALATRIRRCDFGTRVASIARAPRGFEVQAVQHGEAVTYFARSVVVSAAAHAASRMFEASAPAVARALATIEYAPVSVVASAYRREDVAHALDGFGVLVPKKEQRRILGTLFSSSLFEGRAPAGHVLLTTFAGGRRNPDVMTLDDAALAAMVSEELRILLGARTPRWSEIVRWPQAIPQYTIGHLGRVQTVDAAAASMLGLHFCANWRGGVSFGDCIKNGLAMADTVRRALVPEPQAA
ncbi:MAG TPA: protoporphyrinogen oxidase [Casimicrobiaceae bacterium]|nr:protoporphyrinogen oxidase [Casimicrobiaceae bacterium]